jgi:hypothetical protein
VEAVPASTADVVVNSSGNPAPAPQDFFTVASFLAASTVTVQAKLVRLHNLHLTTPLPANAGATTWLNAATVGQNFVVADTAGTTTVLRITSDVHGTVATWQAKTRPSEVNPLDTFDVVAVTATFNPPGNEFSLNDPVGTTAKTDTTGPIRAATSGVPAWKEY